MASSSSSSTCTSTTRTCATSTTWPRRSRTATRWPSSPRSPEADMAEAEDSPKSGDVPEGAAVFPEIPPELASQPLLLAGLPAVDFRAGSDGDGVNPRAAEEALEYMAGYLQRLAGPERQRVQEDLSTLVGYARQEQWPKQLVKFLKTFLADYGVERAD